MPLTRSQARSASNNLPSSAGPSYQPSRSHEFSPQGSLPATQFNIDLTDEHTRLYHKLTKILDLFEPSRLRAHALVNAKAGIFPGHLDSFSRSRTQLYLKFGNAIALVALQDDDLLRTMANSVPDPMIVLHDIHDAIEEALDQNSRNEGSTLAEATTRSHDLQARVNEQISRVTPLLDDHERDAELWSDAAGIFLQVLNDLSDREPRRNVVASTHIELMETANKELSSLPEDVLSDCVDDLESIVERLENRGDALADLTEDVRTTLEKAQNGAQNNG